jgi:molybdopterin-containing oxidoreductase family iron-sulfur binding subunit
MRIDRYFSGAVDNPEVSFQPVTCQHCNHAPCEAVCPVFATTHEPEGLNAQTYNRCVGTRYCANACPYKVRRFNWYTYKWNIMGSDPMDRNPRALNPDVTVRTRGIMEKCTFCVQRIRDAKHNAKQQNRMVFDGEIRPACQTACPTDAIVFGNLLDPNSRVARARKDNRAFLLLGGNPELKEYGLKTLPNLNYMAKVKHDGTEGFAAGDGHDHGAGEPGHGHP